jgi:hypothetical protein
MAGDKGSLSREETPMPRTLWSRLAVVFLVLLPAALKAHGTMDPDTANLPFRASSTPSALLAIFLSRIWRRDVQTSRIEMT